MEVSPYKIIHIDISKETAFISRPAGYGIYFVFWWKDTPVGDWYVQADTKYDNDQFQQQLKKYRSNIVKNAEKTTPEVQNYNPSLSVVICTRNRTKHLEQCLQALEKQTYAPAEIIVVDNAPDDESTYLLTKNWSSVRYIREPVKGLDVARNTGARNSNSEIVVYTDDDVIAHPSWLHYLKTSFADPQVMAMTGLVIAAELDTESQQIFEKYWSFNRGYKDKYYDYAYFLKHVHNVPPVWVIGAGANMAFRREVFEQVGYFDIRLDVGAAGCNGDSEMWFRILAAKGTIHYNPRAVVYHHHRKELSALKRQIYSYMRGFAAAALIQQESDSRLRYRTHLFKTLPKRYIKLAIKGFPHYRANYQTLFVEIRGLLSGIVYYQKHKRKANG